jgi:hypothetical protein
MGGRRVSFVFLVRRMEGVSNGWAGVFRLRRAGLFVPPSRTALDSSLLSGFSTPHQTRGNSDPKGLERVGNRIALCANHCC